MSPRITASPIEHVFGWSLNLERDAPPVALFKDAMRESVWYPPRSVDMKFSAVDVSFDCNLYIGAIAASRPDVSIDVAIGMTRHLIFSGPWLVDANQSRVRTLVVPVRQNLQVFVKGLPGVTGWVHVWMRCAFSQTDPGPA